MKNLNCTTLIKMLTWHGIPKIVLKNAHYQSTFQIYFMLEPFNRTCLSLSTVDSDPSPQLGTPRGSFVCILCLPKLCTHTHYSSTTQSREYCLVIRT